MSVFREGNLFAIKTTSQHPTNKTLVRKKKQTELCIIADQPSKGEFGGHSNLAESAN